MVYRGSRIGAVDNTGVKTLKILQIYKHPHGRVGDMVLSVIRKKKKIKAFVKSKIYYVFIVAQKKALFRSRGFYYLKLLKNRGILLHQDREKILGTRHQGFLTLESKKRAFSQLLRSCRVLV